MKHLLAILIIAACVASCKDSTHDHKQGHDDHDEEHGHGSGETVTLWGQHGDVFAEYTPLVANVSSDTAVHVTHLSNFKPVLRGTLTIELTQSDGTKITTTANAPARAGIFMPPLSPKVTGKCTLAFTVKTAAWTERFETKVCEIHASKPEHADEADEGISFTKEQQWTVDFATAVVAQRAMRGTVRVTAQVKPAVGRHAHLTAPLRGRVRFAKQLPIMGTRVHKGQLLATVTPPVTGATSRVALQATINAAWTELKAARADKARVDRLAKADAISTKRIRQAQTRTALANSRVQAARAHLYEYDASVKGRGGSNAFRVRSPIDGLLVKVEVTSGETVTAGAHLFSVIDVSTIWVVGRVFEPDIPKLTGASEAVFRVEGFDKPFMINAKTGKLITVGHMLDPQTRTVPIVFEVTNPNNALRIGQFASLEVSVGTATNRLAIPRGAVLTDGGRSVVFVHSAGETFERRFVRTGLRAKGWIVINSGLKPGERVVVRGTHIVKLAGTASSAPAHGHAH